MRRKVERDKPLQETGAGLAERFTDVFYDMLSLALTDIQSGKMRIENIGDVQRLYAMWKEVIDYREMMDDRNSGQGQLPQLTSRDMKILDKSDIEEENTDKLEDMSDEDMQKMVLGLMEASNQDNVDEMNEQNS